MTIRLLESFQAVYVLLEKPRAAQIAVAALLAVHTLLLGYSAYVHSPTQNEPAHLVAGLSHWKFWRFELYRVNPPLVRMVASLPLMVAGYEADWSNFHDDFGERPEFRMGKDFVAANGERSFFLFMIARWACIPFSWLGAIVCYLWARDLYGRPSGVLAATIWCFEPNILAHAALITSDAAATALGLAACYTFWRWLQSPTWMQAALTGVVLGLAELAKTTLIVFYPLWPLMWVVYRMWPSFSETRNGVSEGHHYVARDWLREAGMLVLRMAVGLYVLNLGYGFEDSFTRLTDYHFVSDLFTGKEAGDRERGTEEPQTAASPQPPVPSPPSTNRFANTWLGILPVPFPKNYISGIDIQQTDFEHYGRPSYLRGVWRDHGWWYYYLYAATIKVPLALWLLGFLALFLSLRERRGEGAITPEERLCEGVLTPHPSRERPGEGSGSDLPTTNDHRLRTPFRDECILLFPALVIFVVVSSKTGFSEHFRYVLPAFPFFFIAISQVCQIFSPTFGNPTIGYLTAAKKGAYCTTLRPNWRLRFVPLLSASMVAVLSSWFIASSLWVYPHSLSYFNESIRGPRNGAKHLLGSNVDWGQDLRYLAWWAKAEALTSKLRPLRIAYFGGFRPSDVGLDVATSSNMPNGDAAGQLLSVTGHSTDFGRLDLGCQAVSVSYFHHHTRAFHDRVSEKSTLDQGDDDALAILQSTNIVGYSIYLFKRR